MADISVEEVKSAARDVIRKAAEDDTLHEVTLRIARRRVEEQLGLEEGALDTRELKDAVKDAVEQAVQETEAASGSRIDKVEAPQKSEAAEETSTTSKKRKSDAAASGTKKKPRAEPAGQNGKAAKAQSKPASAAKAKSKDATKRTKGQRVVRSASVVPSSDEDDEGREPKSKLANEASTSELSPAPAETSRQDPVSDKDAPEASRPEPINQASESEDPEEAPKPARGRKKKADETSKKAATGRKRKAKDADESPEDAEIKRLKSFVTACGVRKVWSKEFKDIADDKSAQARRLRALLAELGMTGRLSMEKAKAIRAKRELAQELEDVTSFEKAVVTAGPRRQRDQPVKQADQSEEDGDDDVVPKKRAPTARMSIMAFLGDQSDED